MQYTSHYRSPIGNILLAADEIGLTGLWFEGQKYFALYLDNLTPLDYLHHAFLYHFIVVLYRMIPLFPQTAGYLQYEI